MNRLLQIVLVWAMAFAVPAQGMAAVLMVACGPNHVPSQQAFADRTNHSAAEAEHPAGAYANAGERSIDQNASTCAACASCCSAVQILSSMPVATTGGAGPSAMPWKLASFRDFITALPERPPRSLLA